MNSVTVHRDRTCGPFRSPHCRSSLQVAGWVTDYCRWICQPPRSRHSLASWAQLLYHLKLQQMYRVHGQKDSIQSARCIHLGQTPCLKNSAAGILSKKERFGVDISRNKCACADLSSCTGNLEAAGGYGVYTDTWIQVNSLSWSLSRQRELGQKWGECSPTRSIRSIYTNLFNLKISWSLDC